MRLSMTLAAALAASLALAGCWGGDDDDDVVTPPVTPPTATAVPDSALASNTAFVSYLNGQKFDDETSEALTLPSGDPPTSETDEPQTV